MKKERKKKKTSVSLLMNMKRTSGMSMIDYDRRCFSYCRHTHFDFFFRSSSVSTFPFVNEEKNTVGVSARTSMKNRGAHHTQF
jgi:hypothetical protein